MQHIDHSFSTTFFYFNITFFYFRDIFLQIGGLKVIKPYSWHRGVRHGTTESSIRP